MSADRSGTDVRGCPPAGRTGINVHGQREQKVMAGVQTAGKRMSGTSLGKAGFSGK